MRRVGLRGLIAGGALVSSLLLSGSFLPKHASADFDICRTDPIIHLSNGGTLTIQTATQTSASNVAGVAILVSLPRGVRVTSYDETGDNVPEYVVTSPAPSRGDYEVVLGVLARTNAAVTATAQYGGSTASQQGQTNWPIALRVG